MVASAPVRNSMRQTATVRRTTPGPLNILGQPTPGSISSHVIDCRAWEATQNEVTGDGRWLTLTAWKMRVPLDADIEAEDRVVLGNFLLRVETPPIERRGHKLVVLQTLQRQVALAPLPLTWDSLGVVWDSLDLTWERIA